MYHYFLAHSLTCHVNEEGDEAKPTTCETPNDQFCAHIHVNNVVTRKCSDGGGETMDMTDKCIKTPGETTCYCNTDNCNEKCTANECSPMIAQASEKPNGASSPKTTVVAGRLLSDEKELCTATCEGDDGAKKPTAETEKPTDAKKPDEDTPKPEKGASTPKGGKGTATSGSPGNTGSFKIRLAAWIVTIVTFIRLN